MAKKIVPSTMSTTTLPLSELPSDRKLTGHSNYVVWAAHMTLIMMIESLLGHIFNRDDDMKLFDESWARANDHALLILDLNSSGNANVIVMALKTAAEVWDHCGGRMVVVDRVLRVELWCCCEMRRK